jgi:hypothetical protein
VRIADDMEGDSALRARDLETMGDQGGAYALTPDVGLDKQPVKFDVTVSPRLQGRESITVRRLTN